MIAFWIAAFLATAAAAVLIVLQAKRPVAVAADPGQTVYLRQLAEIDDLAERGLIGPDEHALARAEAGRRALRESAEPPEAADSKGSRLGIVLAVAGVGLAALVVYLAVGDPGVPDQPYKSRLEDWRAAAVSERAGELQPAQLAALLRERAKEIPNDAQLLRYLAEMEVRSGDALTGARTLERALAIQPNSAEMWAELGEARALVAEGKITPEARRALEKALALDPKSLAARYLIGRAEIDAGRRDQGLAIWRGMLPDLSAGEQAAMQQEIAAVQAPASVGGRNVDPAIQGMVERLAARLKENPDDPEGWARLVRSYRVLGDEAKLQAALAEARARFKGRAADLSAIEAAAKPAS